MKKQLLIILLVILQSLFVFIPITSSEGEGIFLIDDLGDYEHAGFDLNNIGFTPHIYTNEGLTSFYMPVALKKEDVQNLKESDVEHTIYHGNQNFSDRFTSIEFDIYESDTYWLVMYHMIVKASSNPFSIDFVPKIKGEELYQFAWWNSSWLYYRTLTINPTYIDTDLSNFPVLVNVSAASSAKCDSGNSIRFLNVDNTTEYYYEIEDTWNAASYNFVWVNITSVSSSADTRFLMYYGNSGASDNQSGENVWDSGYKLVSHLNTSDSTTVVVDSTSGYNNGTKLGNAEPAQATGIIGYGQNFDGNNDNISYSNIGDTFWGFEAWIKPATEINKDSSPKDFLRQRSGFYDLFGGCTGAFAGETFTFVQDAPETRIAITENITASWHLLSVSWGDSQFQIYLDGVNLTEITSGVTTAQPTMTNLVLGNLTTGALVQDMDVDEFRVSIVKRNDSWMRAIFHSGNQTLLTFGLERIQENITTNATTGIELTNATARGYAPVTFSGNYDYGFWIGQTTPVVEVNADQNVTGAGTVAAGSNFSYDILSLSEGTLYYVRAWVSNATSFATGNQLNFYTKCDVLTGFTATLSGCNVALAWTRGTGADKTTVVRKVDAYPESITDGTVVYNNTASSYSDTTGSGSHQYYRAWSWVGDKHSDENASADVVVPPCPPTSVGGAILVNNTLNITWTVGTGAITTLIVRKIDSSPATVIDGTVIYNSTGTHHVATDLTENYFYGLWSYANETYSTSVGLDFGALVISCYDEETNDSLYFDVFVSNQSGSQTYESRNNTNSLTINVEDNLPLADRVSIRVSAASNYSDKTEIFTGYSFIENLTVTYVILLQEPESKALTNITCTNTTGPTNSYPAFTLDADVITILADAADEFHQITVTYTHYEYESRTYYRDLTTNHVFILNAYLPPTISSQLYLITVAGPQTEYGADPPIENARVAFKRYISDYDIYVDISILYTDANGQVNLYLIPNTFYKVEISKTGYETAISDYIPSEEILTHLFRLVPETDEEPEEQVIFWDTITFTGTMIDAGYLVLGNITITYTDSNESTINTQIRIYELYNVTTTLVNITNRIGENSFSYTVGSINTSRMHKVWLYFNNSANFELSSPVSIIILPLHPVPEKDDKIDLEGRIVSIFGNFELGWENTVGIVLALMVLMLLGPYNVGVGIIGCAISLFLMQLIFHMWILTPFNPALVFVSPLIFVLGILYMWTVKPEEHV